MPALGDDHLIGVGANDKIGIMRNDDDLTPRFRSRTIRPDHGKWIWGKILLRLINNERTIIFYVDRNAMASFRGKHEQSLIEHAPVERINREAYTEWARSISSWLYDTSHVKLSYNLRYDGVEIEQLSPGTRRIVLLLLYVGCVDGRTPFPCWGEVDSSDFPKRSFTLKGPSLRRSSRFFPVCAPAEGQQARGI